MHTPHEPRRDRGRPRNGPRAVHGQREHHQHSAERTPSVLETARSGRQPFAAAAAASIDNRPPAPCHHSVPKSVAPGPALHIRLIRALHKFLQGRDGIVIGDRPTSASRLPAFPLRYGLAAHYDNQLAAVCQHQPPERQWPHCPRKPLTCVFLMNRSCTDAVQVLQFGAPVEQVPTWLGTTKKVASYPQFVHICGYYFSKFWSCHQMVSATLLWTSCANSIRTQVPDSVWQSTFNPAKPTSLIEDVLELTVPSTIIKDRLEGEYFEVLRNALASSNATHIALKISTDQHTNGEENPPVTLPPPTSIPEVASRALENRTTNALHPNYVFDKFVTGPSNRFALAAALSVAETPGKSYNPLFIHGHAGLGKTHLLQAIGHYVKNHYVSDQRHPIKRVLYVSTETFLNQFVDAIRTNTRSDFKRNYREVDVLLVDDIQFLEGKEGLQEEFFHTFNSLHEVNKQIVLTSDRPPDAIPTLEDRMTSRFKMGLLTDIQPPDLETRLAILRKKAEQSNFTIDDEVLTFIASNIKDNIRELEGALTRVTAYASFNDKPLSLELAQFILRDITSRREPQIVTADIILQATAELFALDIKDIVGPRRQRPLVKARQVSMYVFRELTDLSYPDIARVFGGRDHTTAIHAIQKITTQMAEQPETFNQVTGLIQRIKNA